MPSVMNLLVTNKMLTLNLKTPTSCYKGFCYKGSVTVCFSSILGSLAHRQGSFKNQHGQSIIGLNPFIVIKLFVKHVVTCYKLMP